MASIIGQDGREFGMLLLRGDGAFRRMVQVIEEGDEDDDLDDADLLSVTFEPLGAIDGPFRAPLAAAGFRGRRERIAPALFVKKPFRLPRAPGRGEMRLLHLGLAAVCVADEAGDLHPLSLDSRARRVLELAVDGKPRAPKVRAHVVPWPAGPALVRKRAPLDLSPSLAALPRLAERWLVGLPHLPIVVEGDERTVRGLVVVLEGPHTILAADVIPGEEMEKAARAILRTFAGERPDGLRGLPREISFANAALLDVLAPGLEGLGIRASFENRHPDLAVITDELIAKLSKEGGGGAGGPPETLREWQGAHSRLITRLVEEVQNRGLMTPRALTRYFGDLDTAEDVLEELAELSPYPAFLEWLIADYRATIRSTSFLDKELARVRLDPVERRLLEARLSAELSLYRVDAVEAGATVEVEDILTGRRHTVHDRALSGSGVKGWVLPLRLFRPAEWTFCLLAGPPLGLIEVDAALASLESGGVELTPEGLRRSAHQMGRLWRLFLDRRRRPPVLCNTEGDPIELHAVVFRLADPVALRHALDVRSDLDYDEEEEEWIWLDPAPSGLGIGDGTVLGQLAIHGDRLFLEVNSAPRLKRARAWIEALPGVRFERASIRALDASVGAGEPAGSDFGEVEEDPPDDDLRARRRPSFTPESLAALERMQLEHALHWLDETVPALGNVTPRAACRTPAGRRRVASLIRTMPPLRHPGGEIPAPREALLRELGLPNGT